MISDERRIAILDMDSIAFAIGWGNKIPDGKGNFERDEKGRLLYKDKTEQELEDSCNFMMESILSECNATHYIGYIKGRDTGKHRYKAKPDYKANRPKESPKWWEFVKNYLTNNWNIIQVNDIEVDDAVNITRLNIPNSFMVAVDKDLLHLEGTHYNWRTKEWTTVDDYTAGVYFWKDMIVGQSGDGVSGIPNKGKAYWDRIYINNVREAQSLYCMVLEEYINYFGESKGVEEFYKNYTCLKILEEYEGFEIPEPVEFNKEIIGDSLWEE